MSSAESDLDHTARSVVDWLNDHKNDLTDLAISLVKIPSVTGSEGPLAAQLAKWLGTAGLEPHLECVTNDFRGRYTDFGGEARLSERPNVYGWLRSKESNGAKPVVLNGHLDVVPVGDPEGWRFPPFSGTRAEGAIWGRGSADMKGPIAAGLMAVRALKECSASLPFDVQLQLVIGEETGGIGTLYAIETQPRPQAVIVMEPSQCRVVAASGGSVQFTVDARGKAAHGCVPWTGVSALDLLMTCHRRFVAYARGRNERLAHSLFGDFEQCAPLSIGTFSAGEWRAMVPERGQFSGRIGVLPGEDTNDIREGLRQEVAASLADDRAQSPALSISWPNPGFPAWETETSSPLILAMQEASTAVHETPQVTSVTFGSDAGHFARQGVPVAIFGPGSIEVAHMVDEHVSEHSLLRAAKVLALSLLRLNGEQASNIG
ncbi:M20 family metallopeptidase [Mesorhizobium sp. M0622]|uniref:M20 family metallopeptidase n=1 Tax=Mesorhizobium sp. M0622 TaxID=2956975 RepID=UPI00333E0D17